LLIEIIVTFKFTQQRLDLINKDVHAFIKKVAIFAIFAIFAVFVVFYKKLGANLSALAGTFPDGYFRYP
jgi:hypothetical protein